ncbi:MAG TPA: Crp/Fnr family transcriptional regulator [Halanaerobiales bacterium]|nr:Crp/Fnr family transcriptional regulator [Halanaerobiales bacterium]
MPNLEKIPYFSHLNEEELQIVNEISRVKKYKKDEIIFFEGEKGDYIYIIKKGQVKMLKMNQNGDEQILNIFKKNDILAEVIVFDKENYPATAIALNDVELFAIDSQKLFNIFLDHPQITVKVMKVMSARLRRAQQNIRDFGLKDSKSRLASLLFHLAEKHGKKSGKNQVAISLFLTQKELANMIGTTRETVSRTLNNIEKENIIKTSRKKIIIKDMESLKKLMN